MGNLKDLDLDKLMNEFNIDEFEDLLHPGTVIKKSEDVPVQKTPVEEPEEEVLESSEEDKPLEETLPVPIQKAEVVPTTAVQAVPQEAPGTLTSIVQNKSLNSLQQMEDVLEDARMAVQRVGGADPELLEALSKLFSAYQVQVDSLNKVEIMERRFRMQMEMEKFKAEMKMKVAEHKNKLDIEKKQALTGNTFIQQNFVTFDPQKIVGQVIDVIEAEKKKDS